MAQHQREQMILQQHQQIPGDLVRDSFLSNTIAAQHHQMMDHHMSLGKGPYRLFLQEQQSLPHLRLADSLRQHVEIPDSTGGEISLSADEREPPKVEDL